MKIRKFIEVFLVVLLMAGEAYAQATAAQLMAAGMPSQQAEIVAGVYTGGATAANNAYIKFRDAAGSGNINVLKVDASDNTVINSSASDELILQLADDANRLISYTAASDAALAMKFGDGGTTATQALVVSSSTADADDDSVLRICGGGAYAADGSRGACITVTGEEDTGGSDIEYVAGASDTHVFSAGSTETMNIGATGVVTAAAGFVATTGDIVATNGDIQITATGKTIEFESGTAASACVGASTFNGTTAVTITTTCATTGSKIFLSMTGDPSGSAANDQGGCWATNISNGVSFDADCSDANVNATFNWIIFHEAP